MRTSWYFPCGPVAKTPHFQCRHQGLDPWSGNENPHAATKRLQATTADPACHSKDQRSYLTRLGPGVAK